METRGRARVDSRVPVLGLWGFSFLRVRGSFFLAVGCLGVSGFRVWASVLFKASRFQAP